MKSVKYKFCPLCASPMKDRGDGLLRCRSDRCDFVHYDNPVPVVVALVPAKDRVFLVRRGVPPFAGEWCLPRGHIDRYEHPKAAVCREVLEEAGIDVRVEKLLSACNPSPKDFPLNVLSIFYLCRHVGGEPKAGSDCIDVGLFGRDDMPPLCFRSDRMIVSEWFLGTWGEITGKDLVVQGDYD